MVKYLLAGEAQSLINAGSLDFDRCLELENHSTLPRQWEVFSEDARYAARMGDTISRHGAVSIWSFERFAEKAAIEGYTPVFVDDPSPIFEWYSSLSNPPSVRINSGLEGTVLRDGSPITLVNGFLPFQIQGLNFMRSCKRAVYYQWSTGTGKTIAAEGTILIKKTDWEEANDGGFDLCVYMVRPNNLVGAQRKLSEHTGLASALYVGTPVKREKILTEVYHQAGRGEQPILITNAEKFREDTEGWQMLVADKRVLFIFDEMPVKFANRTTALYRALCSILFTTATPQGVPYPSLDARRCDAFSVAMSATPISNSPEDFFNCIRLLDPEVFGTVQNFNNLFVAMRDEWFRVSRWKNLDLMSAMATAIVHQADKETDPEIKKQFPKKLPPETIFVDLHPKVQKIYDRLQKELLTAKILNPTTGLSDSLIETTELLSAITTFQILINNPRGVLVSALKRDEFDKLWAEEETRLLRQGVEEDELALYETDFKKSFADGSRVSQILRDLVGPEALTDRDKSGECIVTKLTTLKERLDAHPGKAIVFTRLNETCLPFISEWFLEWDIDHVCYPAGGQDAIDLFRRDPDVKVFLSTDAGSDSIDLPEATKTFHYDDPMTEAKKIQRGNRQDRIDSTQEEVQEITLTVPNTIEDRIAEIIAEKKSYRERIFGGEIAEASSSYRRSDLLYILTGARMEE